MGDPFDDSPMLPSRLPQVQSAPQPAAPSAPQPQTQPNPVAGRSAFPPMWIPATLLPRALFVVGCARVITRPVLQRRVPR